MPYVPELPTSTSHKQKNQRVDSKKPSNSKVSSFVKHESLLEPNLDQGLEEVNEYPEVLVETYSQNQSNMHNELKQMEGFEERQEYMLQNQPSHFNDMLSNLESQSQLGLQSPSYF